MKNIHVKNMCILIYVSHMLNICSTYVVLNMCLKCVDIFPVYRIFTEQILQCVRIVSRVLSRYTLGTKLTTYGFCQLLNSTIEQNIN